MDYEELTPHSIVVLSRRKGSPAKPLLDTQPRISNQAL